METDFLTEQHIVRMFVLEQSSDAMQRAAEDK
jgi:hypothetical protein